jgi:hypothetical protein
MTDSSDHTGGSAWLVWGWDGETPTTLVTTPQGAEELALRFHGLDPFAFCLDDYTEDDDEALLEELPDLPERPVKPPLRELRARDRWRAKQAQRKLDAGE